MQEQHKAIPAFWYECHLRIWKNPVKSTVCKQQARCFYSNQHKLINTKNAVQNKLSGAFCESLRSYRVYLSYKFIVAVLPVLSSTFSRTFASTFPRCSPAKRISSGTGFSSSSHMKSTRYRQVSSSFRLE